MSRTMVVAMGLSVVDISDAQLLEPYRQGIMVIVRPGPRCLRVDVFAVSHRLMERKVGHTKITSLKKVALPKILGVD